MKFKRILKVVVFVVIFAVLLNVVTSATSINLSDSSNDYVGMTGIYQEPENSLDAVYIGSSSCYAFWLPTVAFDQYGIAVHPYYCASQPLSTTEYLIKEARKTQPDAVYVVNINTYQEYLLKNDVVMHRLTNYMPLSKNKLELTEFLCDYADLSFKERLEYYLPIIKYHDNWSELEGASFTGLENNVKSSNTFRWFFDEIEDISDIYINSGDITEEDDKKYAITDTLKDSIDSLLDYCEEEDVKVMFVTVPRAEESKKFVSQLNQINEYISERGFTTLNLMDSYEELHLDIRTDYYNDTHTNVHGALKFTKYMAEYLKETYGFGDKRGDENYYSWIEAEKEYSKYLDRYVLDFEYDFSKRDFSLETPEIARVAGDKEEVTVTWEETENADGYAVYRKTTETKWILLGSTQDTKYNDYNLKKDTTYIYTVVPYRTENGKQLYGNFEYNGKKIKL